MSQAAARDVARLEDWLVARNPRAAIRAGRLLRESFASLSDLPERSAIVDQTEYHESIRRFGKGAYVIRYVVRSDAVVVTGVWHSLEARP